MSTIHENSQPGLEKQALPYSNTKEHCLESFQLLVASVVHDLSNNLSIISGYATIAKIQHEKNSPTCIESLKKIDEYIRVASHLLHSIGRSSNQIAIPSPANMHTILSDIAGYISAKRKGQVLVKELLHAGNPHVLGVTSFLFSAFFNLAINGCDAIPDQGILTFETNNILIDPDDYISIIHNVPGGEYLQVTITDTGDGISEWEQKNLFHLYFTTKKHGNGFGLSNVYSCIAAHRGYIEFDSEKGKGTSFRCFLPVNRI